MLGQAERTGERPAEIKGRRPEEDRRAAHAIPSSMGGRLQERILTQAVHRSYQLGVRRRFGRGDHRDAQEGSVGMGEEDAGRADAGVADQP